MRMVTMLAYDLGQLVCKANHRSQTLPNTGEGIVKATKIEAGSSISLDHSLRNDESHKCLLSGMYRLIACFQGSRKFKHRSFLVFSD
jgi:hypothetical protein